MALHPRYLSESLHPLTDTSRGSDHQINQPGRGKEGAGSWAAAKVWVVRYSGLGLGWAESLITPAKTDSDVCKAELKKGCPIKY